MEKVNEEVKTLQGMLAESLKVKPSPGRVSARPASSMGMSAEAKTTTPNRLGVARPATSRLNKPSPATSTEKTTAADKNNGSVSARGGITKPSFGIKRPSTAIGVTKTDSTNVSASRPSTAATRSTLKPPSTVTRNVPAKVEPKAPAEKSTPNKSVSAPRKSIL